MLSVIILAAGQSKRMCSSISKVLHPLGGKPMIKHVVDAVNPLNPGQIVIVTSSGLREHSLLKEYSIAVQEEPKGTGHAVQSALKNLDPRTSEVLILCGDTPLLQTETLQELINQNDDLVLASMRLNADQLEIPYGRIAFDQLGQPRQIIEYKDATPEQRANPVANPGVYKIKIELLQKLLPLLNNNNQAKEYYLTDLVHLAYQQGYKLAVIEGTEEEFKGINTRLELSQAEEVLQDRWRLRLMELGVTLVQPETIFLSHDTVIGKDSRVGPFVTFGTGVNIAENVTVLPFCHIENATLAEASSIGPFAHLRGKAVLQEGASIGNFVEVKGSVIGKKAKAKHLSYIGDAQVGDRVNIGAGTITCNYDGFNKSTTIIEDDAMIGANTSLVAPVTVGEGAIVAAGSTVTESVPADALVIARQQQTVKPQWAKVFKETQRKVKD